MPRTEAKYFVTVFGDPNNGDPVESGRYTAGQRYAAFTAKPGDTLLLYCTEGYAAHPKQVPGIGVAFRTSDIEVEYRWIPLVTPIQLDQIVEKVRITSTK